MAIVTIGDLQTRSDVVKNETAPNANTHQRIGGILRDNVDTLNSLIVAASTAAGNAQTSANSAQSTANGAASAASAAQADATSAASAASAAQTDATSALTLVVQKEDIKAIVTSGGNNITADMDKKTIYGSAASLCSGDITLNDNVGAESVIVYIVHQDSSPPVITLSSGGTPRVTGVYVPGRINLIRCTLIDKAGLTTVEYIN